MKVTRKYGSGNNLFRLGTRHSESVTFLDAKKGIYPIVQPPQQVIIRAVSALWLRLKPERRTPAHATCSHANSVETVFLSSDLANLGHGTRFFPAQST